MSGQCATNAVFNKLLLDLHSDLVPKVINNWNGLTQEEQSELMSMGNFFCKVHHLISFAEEASKALLKFENAALNRNSKYIFSTSGETGAFTLTRTSCGAVQKRRNQQAGMSEDFISYLSEIGSSFHLIQLEGNRFNVTFYDRAAVYFQFSLFKSILCFLKYFLTYNCFMSLPLVCNFDLRLILYQTAKMFYNLLVQGLMVKTASSL